MGSVVVPLLVAEWGVRSPGAVAVSGAGGVLSYGELVGCADRFARLLVARGVGRGEVVGVCMGRGVDLVVALLGVMRAGCAYLPLDPGHPGGRLRFMVGDAGVRFVVVDAGVLGGVGRSCRGLRSWWSFRCRFADGSADGDSAADFADGLFWWWCGVAGGGGW